MKNSYLALICGLILCVVLAMSWCGRKPAPTVAGLSTAPPPLIATPTATPSPAPSATPTPTPASPPPTIEPTATPAPTLSLTAELRGASAKVSPAVILVTTFDASGRLLRTGTGFFAANDGRLITNWHLVQAAAYAVAKSADGKIRNITGVVASSVPLDLAVLKAETKTGVPYARISKTTEQKSLVALVGCSLAKREQPLGAVQITGRESTVGGDSLATSVPISVDASGAPIVDENSEVLGIVATTAQESNAPNKPPSVVVRPAEALTSLLGQTQPDSVGRWVGAPTESPTPSPTPRAKVVYNPSPTYPDRARSFNPPLSGSGRFRIFFDASGQARQVQIVRSTGQPILDQAAVDAFQKWRSTPGYEWTLVIPITFQPR